MITLFIIFAIVFILLSGIRIAQEYQRAIVFRLGRFQSVKGPGIYWLIPLIERQQRVDIRTNTVTLEQQETITKDSVTIKVNAVLWFRITNPEDAIIKVTDYYKAVYQFSVTALRNIIGQHSLDEVLREREQINGTLQKMVDTATEPWGIKIEMVEMKDVEIPEAMQRAMAREAEAIREKRARIVSALRAVTQTGRNDCSRYRLTWAASHSRCSAKIAVQGAVACRKYSRNAVFVMVLPRIFVSYLRSTCVPKYASQNSFP